jgi:hypothetical protein
MHFRSLVPMKKLRDFLRVMRVDNLVKLDTGHGLGIIKELTRLRWKISS